MKNTVGEEIYLRDYQKKAIEKVGNSDCLIIGPTGSGKTIVGYTVSGITEPDNYRDIILTQPIKALSEERYQDLLKQGLDVGIETGDRKTEVSTRIKVLTQEIFHDKYLKNNNDTLVIDELHYIFNNHERSRSYLEAISDMNKNTKLVMMSATIHKPSHFIDYLNNISGRNIKLIEWKDRTTPLKFLEDGISINKIPKNSIVFAFSVKDLENLINSYISNNGKINRNKNTIKEINDILDYYKITNYQIKRYIDFDCSIYHGRLLPKEKRCIEYLYRNNYISVLFSTDALGLGINLPCETIIFSTLNKGDNSEILPSEFHQLSGRAGRYGFFDVGYVTYLKTKKSVRNIKQQFINLTKRKLEDHIVYAPVDVYNLLIQNDGRTEDDELLLMNKFSYIGNNKAKNIEKIINKNKKKLTDIIYAFNCAIKYVQNRVTDEKDLDSFDDLLYSTYIKEYNIFDNFYLNLWVNNILTRNNYILDTQKLLNYNKNQDHKTQFDYLKSLLYLRRYVEAPVFNEQYKVINKELIEETINSLDFTVLNGVLDYN